MGPRRNAPDSAETERKREREREPAFVFFTGNCTSAACASCGCSRPGTTGAHNSTVALYLVQQANRLKRAMLNESSSIGLILVRIYVVLYPREEGAARKDRFLMLI